MCWACQATFKLVRQHAVRKSYCSPIRKALQMQKVRHHMCSVVVHLPLSLTSLISGKQASAGLCVGVVFQSVQCAFTPMHQH